MDKDFIIEEIRRTTRDNGGKPLGIRAFESETGIKEHEWRGVHWARWGDALIEVGFAPNVMQEALDSDSVILQLVELIRQLQRFPTQAERKLHRRSDDTFPSDKVFRRLGMKHELASMVIEFCRADGGFDDVISICEPLATAPVKSRDDDDGSEGTTADGWVYLLKHGRSGHIFKLGASNDLHRRYGELNRQTPEELIPVHEFQTDDPFGIEAYWKKRWEDKQHRREYYKLTPADVRAFKRRRKFM